MRQHTRLLPLDFDEWDWFDKRYFEWYICKHTNVIYKEIKVMWPIAFDDWSETKQIKFKCFLIEKFANSKIRIGYRIAYPFEEEPIDSEYIVSNPESAAMGNGLLSMTKE